MLSLFIIIFFSFLLVVNFNKYFLVLIVTSVWLKNFRVMEGIPFLGQLNIGDVLSLVALSLFLVRRYRTKILSFPAKIPVLLLISSVLISNYFATVKHIIPIVSDFLNYSNLIIFWVVINENKSRNISLFWRSAIAFALLIGTYALFETITRSNLYIQLMNSIDAYSYESFVKEIRFGMKRSQGIFSMHTTNGAVCLYLCFTLLYLKLKTNLLDGNRKAVVAIVLMFFTTLATGARSAILGLGISMLFVVPKNFFNRRTIMVLSLFFIIYILFHSYINDIYMSFIDTDRVNGSSSDMRERQFEIAMLFFIRSMWFGNGLAYTWSDVRTQYEELYGAESLWFPVAIDQGILGIVAHLFFYFFCIWYVIKKQQFDLVYFILGMFAFNTLSSIPNVHFSSILFYILLLTESKSLTILTKKNDIRHKRTLS